MKWHFTKHELPIKYDGIIFITDDKTGWSGYHLECCYVGYYDEAERYFDPNQVVAWFYSSDLIDDYNHFLSNPMNAVKTVDIPTKKIFKR